MALQSTIALATITLQAPSSNVTFSGIPSIYKDLVIVGSVRSTRAAVTEDMRLQINADTGTNYSTVHMYGGGGTSYGSFTDSGTAIAHSLNTSAATANANKFSNMKLEFLDATSSNKHKTILCQNTTESATDGTVTQVWRTAGRWASNTPINSITFFYNIGQIATGTTISLYGRIA